MKATPRKIVYSIVGVTSWLFSAGQITNTSSIIDWRTGVFPKEKPDEIYQIKANGFYRFFGTNRSMANEFYNYGTEGAPILPNTLSIYDDSQLPNFLVNINGRPSKQVSWGFDLFMFQFMNGRIGQTYNGPVSSNPPVYDPMSGNRLGQNMGLLLGINMYGSYYTKRGTFNVRLGGIHWFSMSDLTIANFMGYNRFLLYERAPWDPIGANVGSRYEQMFAQGEIFQDLRWGERAVQGAIVEGINLPNDWSFAVMYGKTELAGGFPTIPNINYGGKLRKAFGTRDFIGFNTLSNLTWLDSINTLPTGFNIHTFEGRKSYRGYELHAEVGAGQYINPFTENRWGEAINAKLKTPRRFLGIPLEMHYYRISPYVVNNNGLFWNTALADANALNTVGEDVQSANVLTPFSSAIVAIGQMTNNRTGLNLNSDFQVNKKLKFSVGYGVSREIEALQNQLTYSRFVNQLIRSRFWPWLFPSGVGPYGRTNVIFRDAYETVQLNVADNAELTAQRFNQVEIHGKYNTKVFNRNFFAFFLGRYTSVTPDINQSPIFSDDKTLQSIANNPIGQRILAVIPAFNDNAFLQQYSSELEMYYQVSKPLFINAYLGYERIIGNRQTELDIDTGNPTNQNGWGTGLGFDLTLGKNAGLYFRHRWFFFEDKSFVLDKYVGQETLVELKVFF
ncbi:MAG: hypothetical protein LAT76_04570 [Schleiferiaceae bacterium]|nr:hypothetical protein [Schleiferiaceae bacterium]